MRARSAPFPDPFPQLTPAIVKMNGKMGKKHTAKIREQVFRDCCIFVPTKYE